MSSGGARWVVGCDGSKGAEQALEWALAHASGRATSIQVVQAWHYPSVAGAGMMALPDIEFEPEMAQSDPERLAARCAEIGIDLTIAVERGVTANVLLESSADASLLVLGTRGLGGFGRLLIGSVSHQCATHAAIPVAVIPSSAATSGDVQRVVVGVDGSAGASAALRWAIEFAPRGATIQVVGAWQPSSWGASIDLYAEAADHDQARGAFDAIVDDFDESSSNLSVERHFARGRAGDVLLDAAAGADVLVVGERGRRGLKAALLGSTATEVLHRAELTTVIVPVPTVES